MTIDEFLQDAHNKIIDQFDRETKELVRTVGDNQGYYHQPHIVEQRERLANAALKLRDLPESIRVFDIKQILYALDGLVGSRYTALQHIADTKEYMRVPAALEELVMHAEYDVLDDGYVWLVRATLLENDNHTFVQYFLTSQEEPDEEQIRKRIKEKCQIVFPLKVVDLKLLSFEMDLDQFSKFIEILAEPKNWDGGRHEKLSAELDLLTQRNLVMNYWTFPPYMK